MNKVYSKVWNASLRQLVVASELAGMHRGSATPGQTGSRTRGARRALAWALAVALAGSALPAVAQVPTQPVASMTSLIPVSDLRPSAQFLRVTVPALNRIQLTRIAPVAAEPGTDHLLAHVGQTAPVAHPSSQSNDVGTQSLAAPIVMQPLAATTGHFLSVNGTSGYANYNNDGAEGANSVAIGPDAHVDSSSNQSAAMGAYAHVIGDQSTAIGNNTFAGGNSSIAVGGDDVDKASSTTYTAVINGTSITDTGANLFTALTGSTAVGTGIYHPTAAGDASIALGAQAQAGGSNADSLADDFTNNGVFDIAIGTQAKSQGFSSIAIGTGATALGDASFALGAAARSEGNDATAFGSGANAVGDSSFAMGHLADAQDEGTIAFGANAGATAENTIAFGFNASADHQNAIAFGANAQATADDSMAFGPGAIANGEKAIAIGPGSVATAAHDGTVVDFSTVGGYSGNIAGAIGSDAGVVSFGQAIQYELDGNGDIVRDANGDPVIAAGGEGVQRQLQNVAPGRISDTSTDAVNGSQLNVTNQQVQSNTSSIVNMLDGGGRPVIYTDAAGNKVTQASDGNWYAAADVNPDGSLDTSGGTPTPVSTASVIASMQNVDGTATNPAKLTNVADGDVSSTSTDAVNGSQLYTTNQNVATNTTNIATNTSDIGDLQTTVDKPISFSGNDDTNGPVVAKLGDTVAITGEATTAGTYSGANLKTVTDATTGAVSLQMADTPSFQGADMGDQKITNVADGTDAGDAVNKSQLDAVASTAGEGWNVSAAGGTASNVKPGDTVDLSSADSNITVSKTDSGTEHDLSVELAKNLDLGTGGSITTGNTVINNTGVTINGGSNPVTLTNSGLDNGGNTITNVADGVNNDDAATVGQVTAATAAATTEVTAGTNVDSVAKTTATDGHSIYTVNADSASVVAGSSGDVEVTAGAKDANNNTAYTVDLSSAAQTALDNAVQYDDGTHSSVTLGNAGTPVTVTNVADGDVSSTSTDAVNGSQLYDVQQAANAGWNVADAAGNSNNIGPNGTVTFDGDSNVTVTESGTDDDGKVTVALNDDISVDSVTAGNSTLDTSGLTVDDGTNTTTYGADGMAIAGGPTISSAGIDAGDKKLTGVADGDVSASSTDAVNGSQLNATNVIVAEQGNSMETVLGGNASYDPTTGTTTMSNIGGTGEDNINDAIQSANDAATAGWNISAQGANSTNVGPNDAVDLNNSDGNIEVSKTGTSNDVTFDLADDITVDSVSLGSLVKLDTTGLIINGGPSVTVNGIDAGGRKITHVAAGTDPTDAVNVSQLNDVADDVQQLADNAVQYDGADKDQITMGGTTSTDGGKTGGTTITNVHRGDVSADSTDAVNGSQLYETNQNVADNSQAIDDLNNGQGGYFHVNDSSDKGKPQATGKDATAGGAGAEASGDNSTAVGSGAKATGTNSVAVGAGSTAERDNAVSVGSDDQPRQVTHVAAGTEDTDAVNVGQLNGAVDKAKGWAKNYTDKRFDTVNQNMNRLGRRVDAGVASAMAMASLPQAYDANQSSAAVALGQFHGQTGIAVGVSTISESGRYVFKLNATTNTEGDAGVGVGAAIVW